MQKYIGKRNLMKKFWKRHEREYGVLYSALCVVYLTNGKKKILRTFPLEKELYVVHSPLEISSTTVLANKIKKDCANNYLKFADGTYLPLTQVERFGPVKIDKKNKFYVCVLWENKELFRGWIRANVIANKDNTYFKEDKFYGLCSEDQRERARNRRKIRGLRALVYRVWQSGLGF